MLSDARAGTFKLRHEMRTNYLPGYKGLEEGASEFHNTFCFLCLQFYMQTFAQGFVYMLSIFLNLICLWFIVLMNHRRMS